MERAGIFTMQRFPRATHPKEGKLQGGRISHIVSNYNHGILQSMPRAEAGQLPLSSEVAGFCNF